MVLLTYLEADEICLIGCHFESKNPFEPKLMNVFGHKVSRILHTNFYFHMGHRVCQWPLQERNKRCKQHISIDENILSTEIALTTTFSFWALSLFVIPNLSVYTLIENIQVFKSSWFFSLQKYCSLLLWSFFTTLGHFHPCCTGLDICPVVITSNFTKSRSLMMHILFCLDRFKGVISSYLEDSKKNHFKNSMMF